LSSTAPNFETRFGRLALTGAALAILVTLLALAALAWAYVSTQSGSMTMSAGPDLASFAIFLATWVVMMAAMMFPAFAPVVLVYAQYTRQRSGTWPLLAAVFVAGYLMIWSAVGVGAYVLVALLVPLIVEIPVVQAAPQVFLGAVIGAAGLYQLTPLKDALLTHCRSPFHWLFRGFRPGARGALLMGIDEGVVCLGCCAGLMLVLLAVGLASVGWMAAVAAVIFGEKVLAPTPAVAKGVAVLLVGFGIAVATIPAVAQFVMGGSPM
jgi:predicted metal-binding membrane protein